MKIADELDHLIARASLLGERLRIGDAEKDSRDLSAGDIACVQRVRDCSQPACLRRHIDRQAVLLRDLPGKLVTIARLPYVFAVLP